MQFIRTPSNLRAIVQCCKILNQNGSELTVKNFSLLHFSSKRTLTNFKTPDLIYFPQIIRWLKTKIGFKVLQKTWDPNFTEGAFIYGSTQAICRITEVISTEDRNDELKDLVTPQLRMQLTKLVKNRLTKLQKQIIILTPTDIKLLIPIEVRLLQENERKVCTVALKSLGVKWHELNGTLRLAIISIHTEFVRDYTDESESSSNGWTVRIFDILECGIVGEVKKQNKKPK